MTTTATTTISMRTSLCAVRPKGREPKMLARGGVIRFTTPDPADLRQSWSICSSLTKLRFVGLGLVPDLGRRKLPSPFVSLEWFIVAFRRLSCPGRTSRWSILRNCLGSEFRVEVSAAFGAAAMQAPIYGLSRRSRGYRLQMITAAGNPSPTCTGATSGLRVFGLAR